ncbi:hypothetical protein GE061_011118 [Apolygus lucorum]|uniref:D-isomer specific 2-hydroxyacid dehydrogenase catalytic domain-containing protein n=1 Tax=Apolygus lucorum TaxID=248454 RepID=A0A8S9XXY5_APOLU|nr:hypothetical protein GE061_011118 [Apolygus lucorum]
MICSVPFGRHLGKIPLALRTRHRVYNSTKLSVISFSSMAKPKVFMTRNDWPKECIDLLQNGQFDLEMWDSEKNKPITKSDLLKKVVGVSAIFCSSPNTIDKDVVKAAGPSLKVVGTFSVGVDHIDLATLKTHGIRLGYTPGVLTEATAELTVALLLATSRKLFEANQAIRDGEWTSAWAPLQWCGPALQGSTVGVYGFGRIGQSVARKLKAFEVSRILYSSSAEKPEGMMIPHSKQYVRILSRR